MPDIFISYRREDTSGYAGRLYDQISAHFGEDHVFMDVADLEPGSDFVDTIEHKVGTCDALIALIGKNWLTIKDEQNHVRLSAPGDFVNVEIAAALKRNIEVVPVLVGGAKMPAPSELPDSLLLLSRRQALEISDVHFTRDVGDLIEALEGPAGTPAAASPTRIKRSLAAALASLCVLTAGFGIWNREKSPQTGKQASAIAQVPAGPSAKPPKVADSADISGNWIAVVQRNGTKFEIYFIFEVVGDKLMGKAIYPTGEAGILNGIVTHDKLAFTTNHTPNFSDEPVTIAVDGTISGSEIQIFTQDKDGYSKGVAHRVNRISQPKVLTR